MKKNILSIIFAACFCLICLPDAHAQKWQWGVRGGGAWAGRNPSPGERNIGITTDKQGNLYGLSIAEEATIGKNNVNVLITSYNNKDVVLTSHRCDGTLRWTKTLGTDDDDQAFSIGADTMGNIYVAGGAYPKRAYHFGDTVITNPLEKYAYLACFDTLGKFRWVRFPAPDTISFNRLNQYVIYDMSVAPNGDVTMLTFLVPGLLSGGGNFVVQEEGVYLLRYNRQGAITALTKMDLQVKGYATFAQNTYTDVYMNLAHTPSGRWIISGSFGGYGGAPFGIGGQVFTKSMFITSFREDGRLLWRRSNDSIYSSVGRAVVDAQGNIYVGGGTWNKDIINGDTVTVDASGSIPMVLKLDSNGRTIWFSYATDNRVPYMNAFVSAGTTAAGIALGNGEVAVVGGCGPLKWGGQSMTTPPNTGYFPFIARLNAFTGAMIKLDSIGRQGGNCFATSIIRAKSGNYYIGGQFDGMMYVRTDTLPTAGGPSDFFLAKYGYPCNCTPPKASVTSGGTAGSLTRSFTFNGTNPTDSVVWHFGDGTSAKGTSVSHTYTVASPYYVVCAVAYTNCGSDMACLSIAAGSTGVGAPSVLADLKVYPNPASDQVTISGTKEGYRYKLYTITGVTVMNGTIQGTQAQVDIRGLAPGIYLLEVADAQGAATRQRIVKQ